MNELLDCGFTFDAEAAKKFERECLQFRRDMRKQPNLKIDAEKLNNPKLIKKFLERHRRKDP